MRRTEKEIRKRIAYIEEVKSLTVGDKNVNTLIYENMLHELLWVLKER